MDTETATHLAMLIRNVDAYLAEHLTGQEMIDFFNGLVDDDIVAEFPATIRDFVNEFHGVTAPLKFRVSEPEDLRVFEAPIGVSRIL